MQLSSFDQKQAKYSTPIRFVSIQADFQSSLCKLSAILDVLTRRKEETSLLRVPQKILVVSLCTIIQSLCFTVQSHRMASFFSPGQKRKKKISPLQDSWASLVRMTKTLAPSQAGVYVNLYKHICQWAFFRAPIPAQMGHINHSLGFLLTEWEQGPTYLWQTPECFPLPTGLPRRGDGR